MKNNTKVRLHLSKQLFESLTREIIKESKANDGYSVAVKQPKEPKQSKDQAKSPEVQKTDKEVTMGEDMHTPEQGKTVTLTLNEYSGVEPEIYEIGKWAVHAFPALLKLSTAGNADGQATADIGQAVVALAGFGTIAIPIALAVGKDSIIAAAKKLRAFVGGKKDVKEGEGGDQELAAAVAHLPKDTVAKIAQKAEKSAPVAEAEKLNEISSEEVAALIGLLPAVGLSAAYIKDVLRTMKAKGLKGKEGWKKASQEVGSDVKAHMDRTVGGNRPGQGHGVDTSHTFGPQN